MVSGLLFRENTHQLLQAKPNLYVGIKTGITNTAGPCLASCLEISGKRYIVIVLNCKSMKYRFKDTENLRKWLFNKEEIKYKEESKPSERI
jgi:D-alanyl-D-alanine carboxypeptidase